MGGEIIGILGVLTGLGLVVVVPIVAIFTVHQRRMAEIHRGPGPDPGMQVQIDHLQAQVNDLRSQLHEHIVRTDQPVSPPQIPTELEQRLGG